jgi:thymidylate kinase
MLIVLGGIDGSGKTTLGGMLAEALSKHREWARSMFTKLVSDRNEVVRYYKILIEIDPNFDPRSQNYVFAFERVRTANETLRGLLDTNDVVIVDRYIHCDIALSRARARDDSMYYTALQHVPVPAIGFVVDVPVEVAMQRIESRPWQPWRFQENEQLLRAARPAYLDVAREFGFQVIDGSGSPADAVARMVECVKAHCL